MELVFEHRDRTRTGSIVFFCKLRESFQNNPLGIEIGEKRSDVLGVGFFFVVFADDVHEILPSRPRSGRGSVRIAPFRSLYTAHFERSMMLCRWKHLVFTQGSGKIISEKDYPSR